MEDRHSCLLIAALVGTVLIGCADPIDGPPSDLAERHAAIQSGLAAADSAESCVPGPYRVENLPGLPQFTVPLGLSAGPAAEVHLLACCKTGLPFHSEREPHGLWGPFGNEVLSTIGFAAGGDIAVSASFRQHVALIGRNWGDVPFNLPDGLMYAQRPAFGPYWEVESIVPVSGGLHWFSFPFAFAIQGDRPSAAFVDPVAFDGNSGPLRYTQRATSSLESQLWPSEAVPGAAAVTSVAMDVDAAGVAHLAYSQSGGVSYARRTVAGTWSTESIAPLGDKPRIRVAKSGQVHVVFASSMGVVYATRSTAGTWTNIVVDGGGASPSLALDGKGRPYLVYFNGQDLFAAQRTTSSGFVLTRITTVSLNDVGPLVTVAPSGRVHIAFRDGYASGCPAADGGTPALTAVSPWDRLPPGGPSPVGRFWFSMAYDGRRHRAYIFGGRSGLVAVDDVWEWNADDGTWKNRTPAGAVPAPLQTGGDPIASAAYDEVRDRVVVVSGGTWEWNPKNGAFTAAIPDRPQALSYDPARQKVVAVGSSGALVEWQPSSTQWVEPRAVGGPIPPAQDLISVSDPDRKRVLFFFGAGDPSMPGTSSIQTWEWNGAKRKWTDLTPASGFKPPLFLTGAAWASRGRVLMFGGEVGRPPATWAFNSSDQTWIWNTASGSWTQPPVRGPVPPMRVNHGMVFDCAHQVVLMFGGRSEPVMPSATANLDDLWRWTPP